MNTLKSTLLYNWNFMRVLRLGLGIFIAIQAVKTYDTFSGLIAAFLLFQAVTNTGCCGTQGCSTAIPKNNIDTIEDVAYEEVKSNKN